MNFIRNNGEVVEVNDRDVQTLEKGNGYTLYGARHNPSGEQMVGVVYDDSNIAKQEAEYADNDIGEAYDPNDTITANPPKTKVISWKNLRLQSAISGEKAVRKGVTGIDIGGSTASLARKLGSFIASGQVSTGVSIRDDPLLFVTTAENWYSYIKNMNTVDIGAEFAAGVSHAQRSSNALFAHEWESDPGHHNLMSRLLPGVDTQDAIAKGQIAYDILTRGREILSQQGYGATQQEVMHRLVFDILRSMPVKQYNYYTLYQLHPDEGNEVYAEFKSRYIPLETAEVEMVLEMQRALESEGDAYAFRTTTNEQTGILSSKLMRAAVADYSVGDTVNVRTLLMTLQAPPYNYRARAVDIAMASGQSGAAVASGTTFLEFNVQNKSAVDLVVNAGSGRKLSNEKIGAYALNIDPQHLDRNNNLRISKAHADNYETILIATSQYNTAPKFVAVRVGGGGNNNNKGGKFKIIAYNEEYLRLGGNDRPDQRARGIRRGLGKQNPAKKAKKNPSGKGRGNFHFVQLWPTTQLDIKKREPVGGMAGGTRHGTGRSKKGQGYWTRGLNKATKDMQNKQLLMMGTHKKTGEEAPYRIKFPVSLFKIVNHPTAGYKTLMPKKDLQNKKFIAAYQDFINHYGLPKHAPSKDTYNRFIIPKSERAKSPYYIDMRKKSGKK